MADIKFVVTKEYGNVNSNGMKLRKVSWNDREAKFDLRSWYDKDGEERPNKGVTLTKEELKTLRDLIDAIFEEEEKPKKTTKAKSVACSRTTTRVTKTTTNTSKSKAKAKTTTKKGGKK